MVRKSQPTAEQRKLEQMQIERERTLRVEKAREESKSFSDQLAFRKRLRGFFSVMSGGFQGFKP